MIVDTHTHLYLPEFDNPSEAVIRALNAGVGHLIFPNVDLGTIAPMKELYNAFSTQTSLAMGLHPTEITDIWEEDLERIKTELDSGTKYVAIGEIGIDLYWDKQFREEQMKAFRAQCEWAVERDLPVIIHCREGLDEILEVFDSIERVPAGVFHSFGGTSEDIERIRRRGDFYFGINGIVTFKNSKLRDTLPSIGADRLLLETDAPYLAPVPHRGKRNESAFIIHTAAYVANHLGMTVEELSNVTTANAATLFHIDVK
ncbi:MAG: TatD family hydrolase [Lachnospiraceae bacterium]|nr:TatD family hydrolase [Lachnospiraceae bacterium]